MDSQGNKGINRRRFIVGVSATVVGASCTSKKRKRDPEPGQAAPTSPKDAIVALSYLIGPWALADRGIADEFLGRFLSDDRLANLSTHSAAIASLPGHLSKPNSGSERLDKIPLDDLSEAQKVALLALLRELYSVAEVRFYAAGQPNAGTCMVDLGFISTVPS